MPVRVAVEALVADGYLQRQENGRLAVNRRRTRRRPAEAEPAAEAPLPEAMLADFVLRQSLAANPDYLREEATAERFGVGRTVVRRIFSQLSGAGMLEHVPRCGWRVRAYREEEMLEYLDAREALEVKALELAEPRLEAAELQRLLTANTPDRAGHPRLDNTLHQYWIERSQNYYVRDFFARYGAYFSALFDQAAIAADTAAEMAREHRAILGALLAGNLATAQRALVEHIRSQRPNVSTMFEKLRQDVSGRL
jgi:DNA-binding GntR family transcriptional regulator